MSTIWFLLLDSVTGEPFKESRATKIPVNISADLDDLKEAIVKKFESTILTGIASSQLVVYKNKEAFDNRNADGGNVPLEEDLPVHELGSTKKTALAVSVPPESIPKKRRASDSSNNTEKEPHPKRKQRWIELNEILRENPEKAIKRDSTGYSFVSWDQVGSIFKLEKYVQPQREIDKVHLNFLVQYLSFTTKCFGDITTGTEAKRLHFIAPILICVCFLFDGDVDIVAEKHMFGTFVRAHGHFEFMVRRGKKAICIVEAKKDDVEQGMAQDLVGCEVAAEIGGLDTVYGIVTNYIQWNFLRSLNDKIEIEECSLELRPSGPESNSLKKIAEKIYSMLS